MSTSKKLDIALDTLGAIGDQTENQGLTQELTNACQAVMDDPTIDNYENVIKAMENAITKEGQSMNDLVGAGGVSGTIIEGLMDEILKKSSSLFQKYNRTHNPLENLEDFIDQDKARNEQLSDYCKGYGEKYDVPPLDELSPAPSAPGSPLILDLDGDGIETTNLENGVYFDHDGDGKLERSATATSDDGFLALDLNGNGTIDYGKELFGDNTVLADGTLAKNGFEALAQYDENADGIIDANDSIYNQLKVFRDLNQDGISQANELFTLKDLDIASLKVTYTESTHVDDMGNEHRQQSQYTKSDGTSFSLTDVWFKVDKSDFIYPTIDIPEDVKQLPDINGIGSLPSLHYAMTVDESGNLKSLVEQYQLGTSTLTDHELLTEIMFVWAGVSGEYSPYYQSSIDTRKIQALEEFYGYSLDKPRGSGVQYTALFEGIFENLKGEIALRLNGIESNLFKEVKWVQEDTSGQWYGDFSSVANSLIELASLQTPEALREINQFFETVSSIDDQYSNNLKNLYSYLFDYANSDSNDLPVGFDKLIHISIIDEFSVGTDTDDELTGTNADDFIAGLDGNDTISGGSGNDIIYGDAGNDVVHGQDGNDQLFGGDGDDTLTVNINGSNTLDGGTGDDVLKVNRSTNYYSQRDIARYASNTLEGGRGNDRLEGSAGAETYVFNRGDGLDTINDYDHNSRSSTSGWNKSDRIVLGEGITLEELRIRRDGNHMVLLIGGPDSGDSITIENAYSDSRYRIEEVVLSDGTTLAPQDIPLYTIDGDNDIRGGGFAETVIVGDGNDTISLEGGNDTIRSGGGVDTVDAGSGNDEVYAGLGGDTVLAGSGNDIVYGEEGNDTLHGQDGNDQLFGGDGDDTLTANINGSNTLDGGTGDDVLKVNRSTNYYSQRDIVRYASNTLEGGRGNDRLEGSAGAETYVFNRGDGLDTINDYDHNSRSSTSGWNKSDRIVLGEGITLEELRIRRDGNHMVLLIGGPDSGDSITIENAYSDSRYRIEEVVLSDGTTLALQDIPLYTIDGDNDIRGGGFAETVIVGDGNDTISLEGGNDTIRSGGGVDTVDAGSGNDEVYAGLGDDTVLAGSGNDIVYGEEGNDTLHGQDGNDQLFGGDGDDTLTVNINGSNTLDGGTGDDVLKVNRSTNYYSQRDIARYASNTLEGGRGNDRLEGSAGAETYVFNRGDGLDTINDYDHNSRSSTSGWNKSDRIVLGEGITLEELRIRRDGNHMVLLIGGPDSGDSITIENAYSDSRYRIEEVVLSDGTTLAPQDIPLYTIDGDNDIRGGGFAETVIVGDGNDTISLEGGNDTIRSGGGVDTVDAGSGNDEVYAGLGDDTVLAGSGNDIVYGEEGNDTLHGQDGNDQLFGGDGDDTLTVNINGSNTLDGGTGDDVLKVNRSTNYYSQRDIARYASNTLEGGRGNDRLEGSAGAETYVFNRGDGLDTINDYDHNSRSSTSGWNKSDRIVLGEGITLEELRIRRDGNHMVLLIGGPDSGDSITIENAYSDSRYRIEEVVLSDGTTLAPQDIPLYTIDGDNDIRGGGFAETVIVGDGNDTISLEGGNDTIRSGGGVDTVDAGSGNDEVYAGLGDDTVLAGSGNDIVYGEEGNDTLHGQDGNDQLFGGDGDDTLTVNINGSNTLDGGTGDDVLKVNRSTNYYSQRDIARYASNTLEGGRGNDRLEGSAGAETYVFNRGDGLDTINDYDHNSRSSTSGWNKSDRIVLGEGITLEELRIRRDGNHMVLLIGGPDSGDSITIENAYSDSRYRIEEVVLSDGTTLAPQDIPLYTIDGDNDIRGGGFAETVIVGDGNDTISLEGGNDTIRSGGGVDTVDAGSGNDEVYAGLGDDTVLAGSGNDIVYGEEGNDTLHGQDGNDQLFGGDGDDTLTVNINGSNTLDGGTGDDVLKVNRSTNYYSQRDIARYASNTLEGGRGNDRLEGSAGAETYVFNRGDGLDTINDYDHNSRSSTSGWNKSDRIVLGEGITLEELRIRRDGNHMVLLIGGPDSGDSITIENAYSDSRYRIEEVVLSDGTTLAPQNIPLYTIDGDNDIRGGGFAETVIVGDGNDTISLEGGNDTIRSGGGVDTVDAGSGNDEVYAGLGDDTVLAGSGNDIVYGEEGNDTLHGQDGNDQLFGGDGDDTLTVNINGSNTLDGGTGDDVLKVNRSTNYYSQRDIARYASNTLEGGRGNDRLEGSAGAETYVFNRGDGLDTINDYDHNSRSSTSGWNKGDRIVLGEGITLEELRIRRDGNHMVLLIGGPDSGDSITIENAYSDSRYRIEEVVLSDGTTLAPQDIPLYTIDGDNDIRGGGFAETVIVGDGNDTISLEGGNDTIRSGGGVDTVDAGSGNDEVYAGLGDDTVLAGSGNDIVYGEEGNDTLHGQDGNDQLFGGDGDDTLTVNINGSNTLDGGTGDDVLKVNRSTNYYSQRDIARYASNTLEGGRGNDRLEGSAGAETYVFNRGDGLDTINDYDHNSRSSTSGWNKSDRIVLGEGITLEELRIRRDGNHMVLLIGGPDSGDSITIENAYSDSRYRIEEVVLSDGTTLAPQDIPLYTIDGDNDIRGGGFAETVIVGDGNDTISLEGGNDTIRSGGGVDTVDAGSGNDEVYAGLGDDTVLAGSGNDIVYGEEGNDTLHGQDGNDQLFGGDGDDTLTVNINGSNTLDGGTGDDVLKVNRSTNYYSQRDIARYASNTLEGGRGNDRLEGSAGAETYVFNRGDGLDTINDYDHNSRSSTSGWNKGDRIVLGEGITLEELRIRRDGNHMVLLIGGPDSGDSITIENACSDSRYRIEEVVLSDGATFSPLDLQEYSEVETDLLVQAMSSFDSSDSSLSIPTVEANVEELSSPLVVNNQN